VLNGIVLSLSSHGSLLRHEVHGVLFLVSSFLGASGVSERALAGDLGGVGWEVRESVLFLQRGVVARGVAEVVEETVLDGLRSLVLIFGLQGVLIKGDLGNVATLSRQHQLSAQVVFFRFGS